MANPTTVDFLCFGSLKLLKWGLILNLIFTSISIVLFNVKKGAERDCFFLGKNTDFDIFSFSRSNQIHISFALIN